MAPLGKKATYIAPGKIGQSRAQGAKNTFLPGALRKTSPNGSDLKTSHVHVTKTTSNGGPKAATVTTNVPQTGEVNLSNSSFMECLNPEDMEDDALDNFDQINSEGEANVHEEAEGTAATTAANTAANTTAATTATTATTATAGAIVPRKRSRKSDAKARSVNKCKKVANLKPGEKLTVDFYNGGPVGTNHKDLTRHMGKLVRDRTICPVRVHSWDEIEEDAKEHMWQSVLNKFAGNGFSLDRSITLEHLKRLWHNWRGILMQNSIKRKGGLDNALKETPNHLTPEDWEWLVKEHFSDSKFKKVSSRNSSNRENLKMPHRTGSMPFRQVIWEDMGVKDGKTPPPISAIFKRTREGNSGKLEEDDVKKYDEIVAVEKEYPSLSQFEIVEKCFGQQDRGSVACFGFGVKPKEVRGPLPSRAELNTIIQEKQKENNDLRTRMDEMEKARQEERKRMDEMEKARQEERAADAQKMNDLNEKFNLFISTYEQRSNGGFNQ